MKKLLSFASIAALAACASGTPMQESKEAAAPIAAGKSRIVVYRQGIYGAAFQPPVTVDGRVTGKCTARGAFSVDVTPGKHILEATTETTKQSLVTVAAGETAYVRCGIGFGVIVGRPTLEVVPTATGKSESASLPFTGRF